MTTKLSNQVNKNSSNQPNSSSIRVELSSLLQSGLIQLKINLTTELKSKLLGYIKLLLKWNQIHNLIASCDSQAILIRHLFDSLSIQPAILGPNILDFGSGGGFPGLPLAIIFPQYNFVLLDSIRKKTAFLNQVVFSLKLKNVTVINNRVEKFKPDLLFDTIVTRATTKIAIIVEKVHKLCKNSGQILVMKGQLPVTELESINHRFIIEPIQVPYLNEQRHLIKILNP